jgi:glycosyltransferase involved in cell wall biosynthesis
MPIDQDPTLFSIVIPTYNRAHLIEGTLARVFAQTYPRYEVILVDNCSEDNTAEVVSKYVESGRIRFIRHDRNYERAKSRNTGMENAAGHYVTLLDSDDVIFPAYLEEAERFIRENQSPPLFHSLYNIVNERGETVYKIQFPPIDRGRRHILNGNYLSCHGVFMAREVYQRYRFDTNPELTGMEDYEFWLRVLADVPLRRLKQYNSGLVQHSGRSLKGFRIEDTLRQRDYILRKFGADPNLLAKYRPHLRRLDSSMHVYAAVQANFNKAYPDTRKYLKTAMAIDPTIALTRRFWAVWRVAALRR